MAARRWISSPGGRVKRWAKSRNDERPGWITTRFWRQVPPRWYRNEWNRRERRRAALALWHGEAHARPYVHPRETARYW